MDDMRREACERGVEMSKKYSKRMDEMKEEACKRGAEMRKELWEKASELQKHQSKERELQNELRMLREERKTTENEMLRNHTADRTVRSQGQIKE